MQRDQTKRGVKGVTWKSGTGSIGAKRKVELAVEEDSYSYASDSQPDDSSNGSNDPTIEKESSAESDNAAFGNSSS